MSHRSRTSACSRSGSGHRRRRVRARPASWLQRSRKRTALPPVTRRLAPGPCRRGRARAGAGAGRCLRPRAARGRAAPTRAATRSRPCCLASYIAASARSISRHSASVGSSPSAGRVSATPIEAVTACPSAVRVAATAGAQALGQPGRLVGVADQAQHDEFLAAGAGQHVGRAGPWRPATRRPPAGRRRRRRGRARR